MANTYLTRTPGSSGNRKTWTFSAWIKRSKISTAQRIFSQGNHSSGDPMTFLAFKSDDTLQFNRYSGILWQVYVVKYSFYRKLVISIKYAN